MARTDAPRSLARCPSLASNADLPLPGSPSRTSVVSPSLPSHASTRSNSGRSIHFPRSSVVSHPRSLREAASNLSSIAVGVRCGSTGAGGKGSASSLFQQDGFEVLGDTASGRLFAREEMAGER